MWFSRLYFYLIQFHSCTGIMCSKPRSRTFVFKYREKKKIMLWNVCRYLDRSYWEQQSQQKQTFQQKQDQGVSDLASTLSPTQPSAPINATKSSLSPTKLSQVKMTEVSFLVRFLLFPTWLFFVRFFSVCHYNQCKDARLF